MGRRGVICDLSEREPLIKTSNRSLIKQFETRTTFETSLFFPIGSPLRAKKLRPPTALGVERDNDCPGKFPLSEKRKTDWGKKKKRTNVGVWMFSGNGATDGYRAPV
jgi:hypothetical protein